MKFEELMMLNADEISYKCLSDKVLVGLALNSGDDFIVTNSVFELKQRFSPVVEELVTRILNESLGDKYVQAQCFKALFELNKYQALEYVERVSDETPLVLLAAMIEMVTIDLEELNFNHEFREKLRGLVALAPMCITDDSRTSQEAKILIDAFL